MSASSPDDFNARIIEQLRANDGWVGKPFENTPLLLLHHKRSPNFAEYQRKTDRVIPAIVLEPVS